MSLQQLDLFPALTAPPAPSGDDTAAWERRALTDLASQDLIYCFPGFMGSICERLVSAGYARSEAAGHMSRDHALFRYRITDAGRRNLPCR
jgi:hypothetical protein